ncbi:hypothetical protein HC891_16820 [Candidatus Gracilibacteria bacterium]|nr:hypothetical protein [Candidatus Gracilibacteria bacterium]
MALTGRCGVATSPDHDALLGNATGNLPKGQNIDVSLIYGDYFYLEALQKLDGLRETCWGSHED